MPECKHNNGEWREAVVGVIFTCPDCSHTVLMSADEAVALLLNERRNNTAVTLRELLWATTGEGRMPPQVPNAVRLRELQSHPKGTES